MSIPGTDPSCQIIVFLQMFLNKFSPPIFPYVSLQVFSSHLCARFLAKVGEELVWSLSHMSSLAQLSELNL